MKNSIKATLILLALSFTSCVAPLPISQLSNTRDEGRWVAGRQYLSQTQNGITVTLSYYKNEDNLLVFDALVDNKTQKDIIVEPGQASIKALFSDKSLLKSISAVNPEQKLVEFDKSASREQAQLANDAIANAVFATTDLVATVADDTNPNVTQAEADARFNDRLYWSQDREADFQRQQQYLERIKDTRLYWEEAPIRKTTVSSNEYINGRLFFERDLKAAFYEVIIEIPEAGSFSFEFEQKVIPVN